MAKMRVYELARQIGIDSRTLIDALRRQGEFVRSASSQLEPPVVRRLMTSADELFPVREIVPRPSQQSMAPEAELRESENETPASLVAGWRAGAVPPPTDPDLLRNIDRLKTRFPDFENHARLLSQLGSQVVYAGTCKVEGFSTSGVALVRFSNAIEAAFGLTREVMIFYSPHNDLQVRTLQAAKTVPRTLGREVTPDVVFLCSPDPRLRERLDDWTKSGTFLAIPLEPNMLESPLDFIKLVRDYIYSRDLFYETTPVHGDRFFGRRVLLQGLRDDARAQRVAGLFGLRKAGKTSVLLQLASDLEDVGCLSVLVDLESFPSPPSDPIPDLLASLRLKLIDELKSRRLRTKELSECSSHPSISEFHNALQALLRKLPAGVPEMVVLMLDEIEYLTPSEKVDVAEGDMPQIAQFLGSMRSLVQETSNFTFILSGLTSQIVESGRLYGRPNPLFSWAKTHHVSPFTADEAAELAKSVGARMGIEMEPGALEALFEATGGHAYLYRNLASTVVMSLPVDVFRRRMSRRDVLTSLENWRLSVVGNLEEMLDHVKRYYPTEGLLLDFLMEEPSEFASLARLEPKALRHLMDLGLVERDGTRFAVNTVLELL